MLAFEYNFYKICLKLKQIRSKIPRSIQFIKINCQDASLVVDSDEPKRSRIPRNDTCYISVRTKEKEICLRNSRLVFPYNVVKFEFHERITSAVRKT
jgi:hypothetical protein